MRYLRQCPAVVALFLAGVTLVVADLVTYPVYPESDFHYDLYAGAQFIYQDWKQGSPMTRVYQVYSREVHLIAMALAASAGVGVTAYWLLSGKESRE